MCTCNNDSVDIDPGEQRHAEALYCVKKYHAKGMHISALQAIIRDVEGKDFSLIELEYARDKNRRIKSKNGVAQ